MYPITGFSTRVYKEVQNSDGKTLADLSSIEQKSEIKFIQYISNTVEVAIPTINKNSPLLFKI